MAHPWLAQGLIWVVHVCCSCCGKPTRSILESGVGGNVGDNRMWIEMDVGVCFVNQGKPCCRWLGADKMGLVTRTIDENDDQVGCTSGGDSPQPRGHH